MPNGKRNGNGFTLIELLVVVAIIALLISILLPSLSVARETARTVACMSIQKQFGMATHMYADANRGYFAPVKTAHGTVPGLAGQYDRWWTHTAFRGMLGVGPWSEASFPSGMVCPSAPSEWREIGRVRNSYAFNRYGAPNPDSMGNRNNRRDMTFHRPSIPQPTEKVQMVDSPHWKTHMFKADYTAWWDVYGDMARPGVLGIVAYRHRENVNALFFDGHAETLSKDEAWSQTDVNVNHAMWNIYWEG